MLNKMFNKKLYGYEKMVTEMQDYKAFKDCIAMYFSDVYHFPKLKDEKDLQFILRYIKTNKLSLKSLKNDRVLVYADKKYFDLLLQDLLLEIYKNEKSKLPNLASAGVIVGGLIGAELGASRVKPTFSPVIDKSYAHNILPQINEIHKNNLNNIQNTGSYSISNSNIETNPYSFTGLSFAQSKNAVTNIPSQQNPDLIISTTTPTYPVPVPGGAPTPVDLNSASYIYNGHTLACQEETKDVVDTLTNQLQNQYHISLGNPQTPEQLINALNSAYKSSFTIVDVSYIQKDIVVKPGLENFVVDMNNGLAQSLQNGFNDIHKNNCPSFWDNIFNTIIGNNIQTHNIPVSTNEVPKSISDTLPLVLNNLGDIVISSGIGMGIGAVVGTTIMTAPILIHMGILKYKTKKILTQNIKEDEKENLNKEEDLSL